MKKQQQRVSQQGRSMVEMLAVLAVVGVLSIGGIMGYNHAMAKGKANDLSDGVSKAAMILSQKTLTGGLVEEKDLSETDGLSFAGYTVKSLAQEAGQDYFEIQATGLPKKICSLLLDMNMASANQIYAGVGEGETLVRKNGEEVDADYTCDEEGNAITWVFDNNLDVAADLEGGEGGEEPSSEPTLEPSPAPDCESEPCNPECDDGSSEWEDECCPYEDCTTNSCVTQEEFSAGGWLLVDNDQSC